jgi:hypothetical protein
MVNSDSCSGNSMYLAKLFLDPTYHTITVESTSKWVGYFHRFLELGHSVSRWLGLATHLYFR